MDKLQSAADLVLREDTSRGVSLNQLAELLRSKGYYVSNPCGAIVMMDGQRLKCIGPMHHQMAHEVRSGD